MRYRTILMLLLCLVKIGFAADPAFQSAFDQAMAFGNQTKSSNYQSIKSFDPHNAFDNYSSSPPQTNYYQGTMQHDTQNMTVDALHEANQDVGTLISQSSKVRPHYTITASDPSVEHAQILQNNANDIIRGVSNQYIDCKPKQSCITQYVDKTCQQTPSAIYRTCNKKLSVDVVAHQTITHYPLTIHLSVNDHHYAGFSVDSVTGNVYFLGPHDAHAKLDGRLPNNIDCRTLQGSIVSSRGNAKIDYVHFPSCSNTLTLDAHISGGQFLDIQLDMMSTVVKNDIQDTWTDDCASINALSVCKLQSQQCDAAGSTRIIQGESVTRDCWDEKLNYFCHPQNPVNTCDSFISQGCEQTGSVCAESNTDECDLFNQTYRCPISQCSPTSDVVCGNGEEYCLDGSCVDHSYQPSTDFGNGVSAISAANDAAKQLDQSALTIFAGHPMECSEKPLGYSNCCSETGWGQDAGLDHCSDVAKQLHVARDQKLAIEVGRYCSGPGPFPCIEHSQVYCVFSSKIAKIIQEQGRTSQLRIGLGTADSPDCRGLSPQELQSIDMSKINFQDYINDLSGKMKTPDLKQIQDMIQQHAAQYQQSGQTHDEH